MPHMRGDEPQLTAAQAELEKRMPHMRGDEPAEKEKQQIIDAVCPTCVGMNRTGDECSIIIEEYAPHAWG